MTSYVMGLRKENMEKEIIILTKSYKHGEYCVAGIDCLDGNWIRLISENVNTENAVPENQLILTDGSELEVYDII